MKKTLNNLPNWEFDINEVSIGVYKIDAVHFSGCSLEFKGEDPDELMRLATDAAREMNNDLENRRNA